jgi:hypothetical protein
MYPGGWGMPSHKTNMTTAAAISRVAWQPLTPRGVAAFARASGRRLLLLQLICAMLAAAATVWFLDTAWFPTVRTAIQQLPAQGEIRSGRLNWPGHPARLLAAGGFLALGVDLEHKGETRSPADVQVEFGRNDVRVISLTGYTAFDYPPGWIIAFNRAEVEPWWGAWRPPILWLTAAAVIIGLLAVWTLLATVYSLPAWLVGFYANRDLNLRACWKLAAAAQMPGALLMTAAILCYGFGLLDLVRFAAIGGVHLVIGWVYLLVCPWFAPGLGRAVAAAGNPFAAPANGIGGSGGKPTGDDSSSDGS